MNIDSGMCVEGMQYQDFHAGRKFDSIEMGIFRKALALGVISTEELGALVGLSKRMISQAMRLSAQVNADAIKPAFDECSRRIHEHYFGGVK